MTAHINLGEHKLPQKFSNFYGPHSVHTLRPPLARRPAAAAPSHVHRREVRVGGEAAMALHQRKNRLVSSSSSAFAGTAADTAEEAPSACGQQRWRAEDLLWRLTYS